MNEPDTIVPLVLMSLLLWSTPRAEAQSHDIPRDSAERGPACPLDEGLTWYFFDTTAPNRSLSPEFLDRGHVVTNDYYTPTEGRYDFWMPWGPEPSERLYGPSASPGLIAHVGFRVGPGCPDGDTIVVSLLLHPTEVLDTAAHVGDTVLVVVVSLHHGEAATTSVASEPTIRAIAKGEILRDAAGLGSSTYREVETVVRIPEWGVVDSIDVSVEWTGRESVAIRSLSICRWSTGSYEATVQSDGRESAGRQEYSDVELSLDRFFEGGRKP